MAANLLQIEHKIQTLDEAIQSTVRYRLKSETIAFTNGCFDLIHKGHIHTIAQAASCADRLIVGLNSDSSIRQLKGDNRPILSQNDRAVILAGLMYVDIVVIFDELTPIELISALSPNVLVKGGDYQKDDVVGAKEVMNAGGRVEIVPFVSGYSTTDIIDKIRKLG